MNPLSQKALTVKMTNGFSVGAVAQFPFNISATDNTWLLCNGAAVLQSAYPVLAQQYPAGCGTFTAITRTPANAPSSNACASDGAKWVLAGSAGSTGVCTTTDGITYNYVSVPASFSCCSILYLGSGNWVAASSGGVSGAIYGNGNLSIWTYGDSNLVTAGAQQSCMAYSPTLGSGSGRIVRAFGSSIANSVSTSDNNGVSWTTQTTPFNLFNVCWTGTQFLATGSSTTQFATSPDGVTWTAITTNITTSAGSVLILLCASDGKGNVVVANDGSTQAVIVSNDNCVTFQTYYLPTYNCTSSNSYFYPKSVSYTGGRFTITSSNSPAGLAVSTTGKNWALAYYPALVVPSLIAVNYVYRSNGVYLSISSNGTTQTLLEDTTKMYLPGQVVNYTGTIQNTQPTYIKAK